MDWPATKRLDQKQYDGLSSEVESYFDKVRAAKLTQQGDQTAVDSQYACAVRFLTKCCSILANDKDPLDPEVERAIASCCHGLGQLCRVTTVDDVTSLSSLKTMLYIVSKLGGKASPATFITLSHAVLAVLKSVPGLDSKVQICDSIPRFYSFLWNAAITLERQSPVSPLQVYQLRLASLRLLAQLPSKRESCLEKLVLALSVFEYQTRRTSSNSEGALKGEELQGGTKSASPEKSKSKKKDQKKGSALLSEKADQAAERSDGSPPEIECVLPSVCVTLEDVLQDGNVSTILLLKLILTLYDILATCKCVQSMGEVKTKVTSLIEASPCNASSEMVLHVLGPVWDMIKIVEHVCEDSAAVELSETEIKTGLTSILTWCHQRHLRTSHTEKRSFVEMFHWFAKQIKNRKIRSDFFLKMDHVVQLLSIFQESQDFFAKDGATLAEEDGEGGTRKQEWREKLSKTHLDVHRCWMMLFYWAVTGTVSAHQACAETERLVSEAENQLAAYMAAIDMSSHCPALEQSERYSVGSLCVRLGHLFYNHGHDIEAITYYDVACRQLVLWCQADPQQHPVRVKEASLLKLHNCLSQGLLKAGRLDDAMTTIQQALSVGVEVTGEEVGVLMKTWLKLKRTAFREGGPSMDQRLARCMVDEEKCSADTVCHYLQLELNWLLKGGRLWVEEGALLKRLHELSPGAKDRDIYRLLMLQFDIINQSTHTDRLDEDQCLQHIACTYPDNTLLQMEVYLIRFFLRVKDKVDKPVTDPPEDDHSVGLPVIGPHDKMIGEEERGVLRAALACWSEGVRANDVERMVGETTEVFRRMMVDLLMIIADILLACREFLLQLETVMVVKLIDTHSHWDSTSSITRQEVDRSVLEALAGVGVEDLPQGLIDTVATLGLEGEKGVEMLQLSLVHFYLNAGKVEKAYPLLNTLRDRELKGELGSLQRGKYNRLLFQCLMTMARPVTAEDYLLPIIQNAYRAHFSVFSRAESGEGTALRPGSPGSSFTHWVKLVELLESVVALGRMYRHIGDCKRAKCYLKDGLTLSRKFGLLKWSTVFGLELTEVLCDLHSLQPMVSTLTATYTSLTTLEPPADRSPPPPPLSSKAQGRRKPSSLKPRAACGVAAEELVKECQREYDSRSQSLHSWQKAQMDEAQCGERFWHRVQLYTKMEEKKRSQLHKDVAEVTSVVLAWCTSLVNHPTGCWCCTCTDAETQCLALTLAKTSLKVIHAHATAELQLEQFFKVIVSRLTKVDPSEKVTQILLALGQSEKVHCRDDQLFQCVTEACSLLVESTLHQHQISQALAHARAGLKAVNHVPLHYPRMWIMKSHMAYLHAVCVRRSRPVRHAQGKGDWRDTWCWLPEAQMEVQIRSKLDQLKIKVASHKKVSPGDEALPLVSHSGKGSSGHGKESLNDCKVCPTEDKICPAEGVSQPLDSSSDKEVCTDFKTTLTEHGVCSTDNSQSSHSVCGRVSVGDVKESPYELVKACPILPDKDDREKTPEGLGDSSLLADKDSVPKNSSQSGEKHSQILSCSITDKHTSPEYETSTSCERPAVQESSQNCRPGRLDQQPPSLLPKAVDSQPKHTSEPSSHRTGDSVKPCRKGKSTAHKSAAQANGQRNKDGAALTQKNSFEEKTSETEPVLFTEETVVTKLFPVSTTSKKENRNAKERKESASQKRKAIPLQCHTPSVTQTPKTPSSVVTLSFTQGLPDSGDEFQPTTPKSTPRVAGWWRRKPSQSRSGEDQAASGCLKLTDVMNSCRPARRAKSATKAGPSDSCSNPETSGSSMGVCEHPSDVSVPAEKPKPAAKPGKNATSKRRGAAHQTVSVETLQQEFARLDVSREGGNTSSDSRHRLPEDPGLLEASTTSRRGRRGRGGTVSGNMDCENIGSRVGTGRRKPAKVLSPMNNIMETQTKRRQKSKEVLQPVVEEVSAGDASGDKRGQVQRGSKARNQTRKNKAAKTDQSPVMQQETDVPQLPKGRKTGRKGALQEKEREKPVAEPSRSRRAAATRSSKALNTDQVILEREVVRGQDDPQEPDMHGDIFDFVDSDGETEPSQAASRKGRKGRQTKIPVSKTGKKLAARRTASTKVTTKPSKSVTSEPNIAPCTTASLPSKTSTVIPKAASECTNPLTDSKEPSALTQTILKETSISNTVSALHTDLTSIETLRMGDLTCMMKTVEEKSLVRDPSISHSGPGCTGKAGNHHSDFTPQNIWHLESFLSRFQTGVTYVGGDGGDIMDSLVASTSDLLLSDSKDDLLRKVQADLTESLFQIQHFPHVTTFGESSKLVAQIKLDQGGDPWEIAALLSESLAVSLRHQFLAYYHKLVRSLDTESGEKQGSSAADLKTCLQDLLFPWDLHRYRQVVHDIPQGWTVCQFSVVDSPGSPALLLTRLTCDQEPLTVELPHFFDHKGQSIYFGFKDILKVNDDVQKIKDNSLWWRHRATLEVKLANLLEGMEKYWLGSWKGMLAGQTSDSDYNATMTSAASTLVSLLLSQLDCRWSLGKARQAVDLMQHTKDVATVLSHLLQRDDIASNAQLLSAINAQVVDALPKVTGADLPVVLILDKQVTNFPIELLGVMKNQAVTRVPSLSLFHHLLKRHGALGTMATGRGTDGVGQGAAGTSGSLVERGVDPTSVFYLMNPDGDLVKSQKFLEPLFQSKEKWQGIAGTLPTKEQYEQALSHHDLFVYCGHGNGGKYFSMEDVLKTKCRAVPLLFGCASVRLDELPNLDAEGYFYSYLLAGSPCVLGNLWDVTDRDIDAFGMEIFNLWLKEDPADPRPSLTSLVQQARSVCRMPLLNGGAPVLYGLPVPLLRPST